MCQALALLILRRLSEVIAIIILFYRQADTES